MVLAKFQSIALLNGEGMAVRVHFVKENVSFYEEDRFLDRGKLSINERYPSIFILIMFCAC